MDITYKLPHPVRIKCTEAGEAKVQLDDKLYSEIFSSEEMENYCLTHLVALFMRRYPAQFEAYSHMAGTAHMASVYLSTKLMPYRFRSQSGNIFTTSNSIDQLLEQTDIGDDIPIAYLRPPFKNCFIEFTEDRSSSLRLYSEETHEHILEGVYISEVEVLPGSDAMWYLRGNPVVDLSKPLRVLDLMFTGSPLGKKHNEDDVLRIQGFYVQDGITINDELKRVESLYSGDLDFSDDIGYLSKALNHMAKVLLFVNCKQYRDTAFNERKDYLKKIESLKSPAKIRKHEGKLRKTYDRIIIKPADNVIYEAGEEHESPDRQPPKQAHWRKGHFRMQPYGPGATKRKVIFIEPTVVGGIYANKKSYDVQTK